MIHPWLSILDLQVLYSNVKKALECTEESSSDYTIIVPVFDDPSYLQNYEYLRGHKDKVVIASLLRQNTKMDAFIVRLMSEGFTVNAELENEQQNSATKYYSLMKRTIETGVYDGLRQVSIRSVKTKYTVFLDGDSVPNGNIGRAIAVMEREGLDLASVRVIPSSEKKLIEKMQAIEYKIAMRGRHFRPWLTSGACCIGRTTALREIMNTHSLYFSGGDAEIGMIAKEMKQKIGYINFTVLTDIPSTFSSWFKQRVNWFGGTFRLFAINFDKHLKSPLLLTYLLFFVFALLPIKLLDISHDWVILPLVLLLYIPITFANWQVRNRYMLLFPLYSAFHILVLPFLGVVKYLHSLIKYKRVGRIKVRRASVRVSTQEEETTAIMIPPQSGILMLPPPEEEQATNKQNRPIDRRIVYQDSKLTNYIKFRSRMRCQGDRMSHPAPLLKRYLMELNERISKLDVKTEDKMRTVSEHVSKLDAKLDDSVRTTNEAVGRLDSKVVNSVQSTNETISKLDSKLDGSMRTVSETISKLDQKLDGSLQTTNEAIGELYREKLSVQEFREFVNVFNKVLGESFPLPEAILPQTSEPAAQESSAKDDSGSQVEAVVDLEAESGASRNTEATSSSQTAARAPIASRGNAHQDVF